MCVALYAVSFEYPNVFERKAVLGGWGLVKGSLLKRTNTGNYEEYTSAAAANNRKQNGILTVCSKAPIRKYYEKIQASAAAANYQKHDEWDTHSSWFPADPVTMKMVAFGFTEKQNQRNNEIVNGLMK